MPSQLGVHEGRKKGERREKEGRKSEQEGTKKGARTVKEGRTKRHRRSPTELDGRNPHRGTILLTSSVKTSRRGQDASKRPQSVSPWAQVSSEKFATRRLDWSP
jgi:hypothetical protein